MVVDINVFTGHWPTRPVRGDLSSVHDTLLALGVDRICLSPLDAVWCRNPHLYNHVVYDAASRYDEVIPVPVIDPTIATWRDELRRAETDPRTRAVRILPAFSRYDLAETDELLSALAVAELALIVQVRMEDPRRQHPLALVPDVPLAEIIAISERHPRTDVIVAGLQWSQIRSIAADLLRLSNLYTDLSQADGMDSVRVFVEAELREKLLFGSNVPLSVAMAGLSRAIADVDDESAAAIIGGNAQRVLRVT